MADMTDCRMLFGSVAHFILLGSVFKAVDGCILGNTQDNFHDAVWGSALNCQARW